MQLYLRLDFGEQPNILFGFYFQEQFYVFRNNNNIY